MSCTFKPCPVEINGDGGLKREHLEFSSSATKSMSLLSQDLWLPNLTGGWLTMSGTHPKVKWLWLRGLSKSRDKLKSFYLYCQSACYYQTWSDGNLPWWGPTHEVIWPFDHMILRDHVTVKLLYLHYHGAYGHQTWQDGDIPWQVHCHKVI